MHLGAFRIKQMPPDQPEVALGSNDPGTSVGWSRFRWIVGAILLFAVATKSLEATRLLNSGGLLGSPWRLFPTIGAETAIAVHILLAAPRHAWLVTMVTFTMFLGISVISLTMQVPCNCLGSITRPEVIVGLDILVIVTAYWLRPTPRISARSSGQLSLRMAVVGGMIVSGLAYAHHRREMASNHMSVLLADSTVNRKWPIDGDYHPRLIALERGKWMVLVLRPDCEHCRAIVSTHFSDTSRRPAGHDIAVFHATHQGPWPFVFNNVSLDVRSLHTITWPNEPPFVAVPAVFVVEEGVVVAAADGVAAEPLLDRMLAEDGE